VQFSRAREREVPRYKETGYPTSSFAPTESDNLDRFVPCGSANAGEQLPTGNNEEPDGVRLDRLENDVVSTQLVNTVMFPTLAITQHRGFEVGSMLAIDAAIDTQNTRLVPESKQFEAPDPPIMKQRAQRREAAAEQTRLAARGRFPVKPLIVQRADDTKPVAGE